MLGSTAAFRYISDTADKKATVKESKGQTDSKVLCKQRLLSSELAILRLQVGMKVQHQSRCNCGKDYLEIWRKEKYQWLLLIFLS